jgi:putative ATP-dependent endonuclease of OLD family
MRVAQIKIQNYRCIKSLDFTPSIHNVLIGRVNAGKSTLLSALALVLDPEVTRRYRLIEELDFYEGKMFDAKDRPIEIKIEVAISYCSVDDTNHFLEYWEPWNIMEKKLIKDADDISVLENENNIFAFRIGFQAKYDMNEREIIPFWYYPKFSFLGGSDEYRPCYRPEREKVGFFLIPAERDISRALSFTRYSALDKALRADRINLDKEIGNIAESVRGVGGLLFDNKDFELLINEVEGRIETMLELNPDIARKLSFELSGLGHYDLMNVLRAFVSPEGAPRPYPVTNQGMGAKQIIALATLRMLAARKRSCILGIEEPETSLHPHMQRSLVNDLLRTSCQTFITTHSVHVSQAAQQEHLYSFADIRNGEKQVLNIQPSKAMGCTTSTVKSMKRIRAHYPSDVLDSLFAPRIVLLEGPGDRESIPVLIRKLSNRKDEDKTDLDGLGIASIPCKGKQEIPRVAPYFKLLGKVVYALADSEKKTSSVDEDIVEACDCAFFWPDKTAIEKILIEKVSEDTVDNFIEYVTELEDDFFKEAQTAKKDFEQKNEDLMRYIKKRSGHRQFAEFIPVDEISDAIDVLLEKLNLVCSGKDDIRKVVLGA